MKLHWHMHSGGVGAADGKHGYTAAGAFGSYEIQPFSNRLGRHAGNILHFINRKGRLAGGLWQRLGTFNHPNKAKAAAKQHAEKHFGCKPRRRR